MMPIPAFLGEFQVLGIRIRDGWKASGDGSRGGKDQNISEDSAGLV